MAAQTAARRPRVVFVDDDACILQGLRRHFSARDAVWDLRWYSNPREALDLLASMQVDVMVTDMRMPGIDGAQLLAEVRRRQPGCVRFMLSGHADRLCAVRAIGPTHQYFTKPCDPRILDAAIERALAAKAILDVPPIVELLTQAQALPALPRTVQRIHAALRVPEPNMARVADIIASDVGLTLHVLKLANSAFFYRGTEVDSVPRAVQLLGLDLIEPLVTLAGVFDAGRCRALDLDAIDDLEAQSVRISMLARQIAQLERLDARLCNLCACAGMLAHVGSLVLLVHRASQMRGVAAALHEGYNTRNVDPVALERELVGVAHPEVGAALLGLWGFDAAIVEAVHAHHQPPAPDPDVPDALDVHAILYVAQLLVETTSGVPQFQNTVSPRERARAELEIGLHPDSGLVDRIPFWLDALADHAL